jgi:hypothetical protein
VGFNSAFKGLIVARDSKSWAILKLTEFCFFVPVDVPDLFDLV